MSNGELLLDLPVFQLILKYNNKVCYNKPLTFDKACSMVVNGREWRVGYWVLWKWRMKTAAPLLCSISLTAADRGACVPCHGALALLSAGNHRWQTKSFPKVPTIACIDVTLYDILMTVNLSKLLLDRWVRRGAFCDFSVELCGWQPPEWWG